MNFNGYFSIKKVSAPTPLNKNSRSGDALHTVEAVGVTIAERVYDEQAGQYKNVSRECDITFTDLTLKHAKIITEGCDISIFGATVFSYMVDIGFQASTAKGIASLANYNNEEDKQVYMVEDVINGIVAAIGEPYRESLHIMMPSQRRKTVILVRPGQWGLRASAADIQNAQTGEVIMSDVPY